MLIVASLFLVLAQKKALSDIDEQIQNTTEIIQKSLPQRTFAVENQYTNASMPVLNISGIDYCALLEVPAASVVLPIANVWNNAEITPERYSGSLYNGTMIIGGKGTEYQLEFVTQLDIGNKITIIDMYGNQFDYIIERIDRAKNVDIDNLSSKDYRFTIFAYITKEKNYVVVRCE